MTSPEAKRMWRRAIKEHFNCQCVYCGKTYELNELTLDHVVPRFNGDKQLQEIWFHPAGNVIRTKVRITGSPG
jgi:5-methylcytosine-specific restriction endonuclease McrA